MIQVRQGYSYVGDDKRVYSIGPRKLQLCVGYETFLKEEEGCLRVASYSKQILIF